MDNILTNKITIDFVLSIILFTQIALRVSNKRMMPI
jgi:hypothetical protein